LLTQLISIPYIVSHIVFLLSILIIFCSRFVVFFNSIKWSFL